MHKSLKPDYYADNIFDVDFDALSAAGISFIILDVDNTLMTYGEDSAPGAVKRLIAGLREKGFNACVLSNGHSGRIMKVADELGLDFIGDALKPLKKGFKRIFAKYGNTPASTVLIGDQLFTDIWGASGAGIRSVLVRPLKTGNEPPFVKFKRLLEKPVLRKIHRADDVTFFPPAGGEGG